MSTFEVMKQSFTFNRNRTLALCDEIAKLPDPQAALAFRPGPGRAHLGWQLMHIGVTEELFASERLAPDKAGQWTELWPRFRGGSKADDNVPTLAEIRADPGRLAPAAARNARYLQRRSPRRNPARPGRTQANDARRVVLVELARSPSSGPGPRDVERVQGYGLQASGFRKIMLELTYSDAADSDEEQGKRLIST